MRRARGVARFPQVFRSDALHQEPTVSGTPRLQESPTTKGPPFDDPDAASGGGLVTWFSLRDADADGEKV